MVCISWPATFYFKILQDGRASLFGRLLEVLGSQDRSDDRSSHHSRGGSKARGRRQVQPALQGIRPLSVEIERKLVRPSAITPLAIHRHSIAMSSRTLNNVPDARTS